jgi:hypothetical protein
LRRDIGIVLRAIGGTTTAAFAGSDAGGETRFAFKSMIVPTLMSN